MKLDLKHHKVMGLMGPATCPTWIKVQGNFYFTLIARLHQRLL